MSRKKTKSRIPLIVGIIAIVLVVVGLLRGGYLFQEQKKSEKQTQEVLESMKTLIPGLGTETESSGTMGRDPLVALSVNGTDVVGCLEIPALDVTAPVLTKKNKKPYCVTWVSGSPVKGKLRIEGGRRDIFRRLSKANPGDKVLFTDIDGTRYAYEVTTQYHLKDWAKADNDLLLCYTVNEDTDFVLGCTYED